MADLITMLSAVAGQQGEEVDDDFNQTVLLLHGDGTNGAQNNTFLDSSTNNFTITRNGNTTQGTFSPFSVGAGEWSNYFDGTDDFLTLPTTSGLELLYTTAWCMEAWIYSPNNYTPAAWAGGGSNELFLTNSARSFAIFGARAFNANGDAVLITSTNTITANTWGHVALTCNGSGTITLYVNGVNSGSTTTTKNAYINKIGNGNTGSLFIGYISNARIVKGSEVYTSAFTPPTAPLTAITNTSLLTCQSNRFVDNSTNAFAITRNGDVRVTPFSPFAPTAAYSAGTNGGSGYFDGSGDYLDIADNAVLTPSGDFCIELWAYPTSSSGTQEWYSKGPGIQIYIAAGNWGIALSSNNTTTYYFSNNTKPVIANAWTHLAVTRSGNTYKWFVNGEEIATTTNSSPPGTGSNVVRIGGVTGANLYPAFGYIGGVRYVNGSAVYTSAFTPPTAPLTAITNTSLLLNFTNAGIIDNTGKNVLETVGNAQIDTTTKKYGTGSMEFDGTGDWLQAPNSPEWLMTGDWTLECWIYPTSVTGVRAIIDTRRGNSTGSPVMYTNGTNLVIDTGSAAVVSAGTITINTWQHIAATRSGNSWRLFINGTQVGSTTTNTTSYTTSYGVYVGNSWANEYFNGYIDDLRITKGVARYTANFTAPTKAFPDQ